MRLKPRKPGEPRFLLFFIPFAGFLNRAVDLQLRQSESHLHRGPDSASSRGALLPLIFASQANSFLFPP